MWTEENCAGSQAFHFLFVVNCELYGNKLTGWESQKLLLPTRQEYTVSCMTLEWYE